MANRVKKEFRAPSDVAALNRKDIQGALVLFLGDDDCMCIVGSDAGVTHEEYREVSWKSCCT